MTVWLPGARKTTARKTTGRSPNRATTAPPSRPCPKRMPWPRPSPNRRPGWCIPWHLPPFGPKSQAPPGLQGLRGARPPPQHFRPRSQGQKQVFPTRRPPTPDPRYRPSNGFLPRRNGRSRHKPLPIPALRVRSALLLCRTDGPWRRRVRPAVRPPPPGPGPIPPIRRCWVQGNPAGRTSPGRPPSCGRHCQRVWLGYLRWLTPQHPHRRTGTAGPDRPCRHSNLLPRQKPGAVSPPAGPLAPWSRRTARPLPPCQQRTAGLKKPPPPGLGASVRCQPPDRRA